jgi:acetyl-CoA synthetase
MLLKTITTMETRMSSTTTQQGPQESRVFNPPAAFVAQATVAGMDAYNALCAEAEASTVIC